MNLLKVNIHESKVFFALCYCSWSFNELILLHIYWVEKVYQSLQKKQKKEVNDTLTSQNHEDDKDNII
jgi:hypothetical protein